MQILRRLQLHRFAGHLAVVPIGIVRETLRTRCLAWWRYRQKRYHSKFDDLHPKRFHVWRWAAQLVEHYREPETCDKEDNVGWMLKAESRLDWREGSKNLRHAVREQGKWHFVVFADWCLHLRGGTSIGKERKERSVFAEASEW